MAWYRGDFLIWRHRQVSLTLSRLHLTYLETQEFLAIRWRVARERLCEGRRDFGHLNCRVQSFLFIWLSFSNCICRGYRLAIIVLSGNYFSYPAVSCSFLLLAEFFTHKYGLRLCVDFICGLWWYALQEWLVLDANSFKWRQQRVQRIEHFNLLPSIYNDLVLVALQAFINRSSCCNFYFNIFLFLMWRRLQFIVREGHSFIMVLVSTFKGLIRFHLYLDWVWLRVRLLIALINLAVESLFVLRSLHYSGGDVNWVVCLKDIN